MKTEPAESTEVEQPERKSSEIASRVAQIDSSPETAKLFSDISILILDKGKKIESPEQGEGKWLEMTTPEGQYFLTEHLVDGTVTLSTTSSLRDGHTVDTSLDLKPREFVKFSLMPNGKIWYEGVDRPSSEDATTLQRLSVEFEKAKASATSTGRLKSFAKRLSSGKIFPKMK